MACPKNQVNASCQTPLSWAAEKGHEAMAKLLLDKEGVDSDSKDSSLWVNRNSTIALTVRCRYNQVAQNSRPF